MPANTWKENSASLLLSMSYSKTWSAVVSTVSSLTQQKAEITTSLLLAWTSVCAVCVSSAVKYQSGHQNYAFITSHSSAVNTSLWNPETGKTFSRRAKNEQSFCESWQLLHLRLQTEEMFFKFKFNGNYEAIPNFSPLDTAWWITHWLTWHSECKASFQLIFQKLSSLLTVFGFWSPSPFISSVNHIPVTGMDFGVSPFCVGYFHLRAAFPLCFCHLLPTHWKSKPSASPPNSNWFHTTKAVTYVLFLTWS